MSILTPTFNFLDFIPLYQLRSHLSMFKLYTEWTWARMHRPDVCKIADGEEKTSPLLYPDKITHFLLFLLKKGISSHCFGWQVSNSQACYWGISLVGWIAGKVIAKSVACLCRVESREGLEECEIISSFTRQSRNLVSTLFISLLLSHVTGNTFISSLTDKVRFLPCLISKRYRFQVAHLKLQNFRTK